MACHAFHVVPLLKSRSFDRKTLFLVRLICYTRDMKRLLPVIALLVLFTAAATYGRLHRVPNPDPNHTHADFAVWINGVQLDFAQEKYMSRVPVAFSPNQSFSFVPRVSAHEDEPEGGSGVLVTGREFLHLHDMNGHVIHRHKPGLGFGDFLSSIGFMLTETCLTTDTGVTTCNRDAGDIWRLYVNGMQVTPLPVNYLFADGDQILLTFGAEADVPEQLSALTDDACKYSKTCPGRGAPPAENCIADPTIPCTVL